MYSSAVVFLLSHALWQFAAANDLFKIAVEGNQTELKCWTNHTLGVDWVLNTTNMTRLTVFRERVIPINYNLKDHYSVESVNVSKGELFHLSIRNILPSHAGIYECIDGLLRSVIARTELIVISSITCNYAAEEEENIYLNSFCSFTVIGSTFMKLEWSEDSCANDTQWFCNGRDSCEAIVNFNNNSVTRTLPIRFPEAKGHWTSCNATSLSMDNDEPNDSWNNFTKVFRFKVSLRCSQNPTTTQTASAPNGSNSTESPNDLWFVLVVVGPLAGSVLTLIIIVIAFKAVQFRRRKERPMVADTNASEFGTLRMANGNREENTFYEEIIDLNVTQVVSYYNISAVEQRIQANAVVCNSIPRSAEIDYRTNDGYLQEGVGIYSECRRLPSETE